MRFHWPKPESRSPKPIFRSPTLEAITRLVADSLARHGLDRPVDPRRLQWSRWFRCDSPHSLLVVPSKPGIFALAEEVAELGTDHVGAGHSPAQVAATEPPVRRMLAVLQFSEDDDMAFTLDRMFTRVNPMRARLASGRCFLRFVVIEDHAQRRSICTALNQWMLNSAGKATTGLTADFQSSLELTSDRAGDSPAHARIGTTRVGRTLLPDSADDTTNHVGQAPSPVTVGAIRTSAQVTQPGPEKGFASAAPHLDSGAAKNLHCPHPLPSGF